EPFEADRLISCERAVGRRNRAGEIEAKHCADQQPRIEFGGFDRGGFQARGQRAARGVDGLAEGIGHVLPWRKTILSSSLRKQGPIRRGLSIWEVGVVCSRNN